MSCITSICTTVRRIVQPSNPNVYYISGIALSNSCLRHVVEYPIQTEIIDGRSNTATFDIFSMCNRYICLQTIYVFIRWKEPLRLYDSFAFHPFPVEDFLGERVVCIWIVTSAIWRRSVRDRIWRLWLEKVYNGWELPQLSVQK